MLNTFDRVRIIVANNLNYGGNKIDPLDISLENQLIEDLGADSLDIVEIVMEVEEEFDIDIKDHEAEQLHTVQNIVNLIKAKKGA